MVVESKRRDPRKRRKGANDCHCQMWDGSVNLAGGLVCGEPSCEPSRIVYQGVVSTCSRVILSRVRMVRNQNILPWWGWPEEPARAC